MIDVAGAVFRLTTSASSYWFRVTPHGHLEHIHYGVRLPIDQDPDTMAIKRTAEIGTSVAYDTSDPLYSLDHLCLEWSGTGMGDYRTPPIEVVTGDGSYTSDFRYVDHRVRPGAMTSSILPVAQASEGDGDEGAQTLEVRLLDEAAHLELTLEYTVFVMTNVIARRAIVSNRGQQPVSLRHLSSSMIDLPDRGYRLLSLHGGWIKEAHVEDRPLSHGIHTLSSTTGASSNRTNPGFLLAEQGATETHGRVYGFNLVYSGNHASSIEVTGLDLVRVTTGINRHCFEWRLGPGESFESPQAVMTFSGDGIGQASRNFHDLVNNHVVRGSWANRPRPVLYNNWESTFFSYRAGRLLRLARQAKALGAELFVLDDGWFGKRDSDTAGLGDYTVNRRKFPAGLPAFADQIRRLGLDFGIWVEPEMVNEDSDLFRAHPDWAVTTPGRTPAQGRHQLVLDLTRAEVRDHIVEQVGRVIDSTRATYVKWDFNRPLSDGFSAGLASQGEFFHRYVLGLYEILRRIFWARPHVLLESCASGGNRFDLGMLCFSPQIWASDDTDPVERLAIQQGLSYLYPQSAMGAHISDSPHQQTLRNTPLTTRFNVAAFGCLGLELDLAMLSRVERAEIREEIAFYKQHRRTFQYGRHHRADRDCGAKPTTVVWTVVAPDGAKALTGLFQTLTSAAEPFDRLPIDGLNPVSRYRLATRPQSIFIGRFGGLVKHLLPVRLNPEGVILGVAKRVYRMTDCVEAYEGYGAALLDGIPLANQFQGSNYNEHTRLLGDFGSNLYVTTRVGESDEVRDDGDPG
ncbi:MAG: alpha-galactosidase [Propionibacteriaceae bacterium]|nr:alpha-galactosidase [Propionibacteriaceae bacterium]